GRRESNPATARPATVITAKVATPPGPLIGIPSSAPPTPPRMSTPAPTAGASDARTSAELPGRRNTRVHPAPATPSSNRITIAQAGPAIHPGTDGGTAAA